MSNVDFILRITSEDAGQTQALGIALGKRLRGGEVIELVSDLGGGKTTLVKGLAEGVGSQDHVSSPTFTMSNVYDADGLRLQHFDFYRLNEPGIMANELAEVIEDPDNITVVEWSDVIKEVLPAERLTIRIMQTGTDERKIEISVPPTYQYLFGEARQ
jgi:tRNA threonylcarbamoyladenosine biosynthesis protein TsaE